MDKIFGYTWEQIQRAQQGGSLHNLVDVSKPPTQDTQRLEDDMYMLKNLGKDGLEEAKYYGVIDRLKRSGLWPESGE